MKKLPTIDERNDSVNEDLPNYDRSVHARGSLTNRHMLSQKRRANLNKMIKRITEQCMKYIDKGRNRELEDYLISISEDPCEAT